MPLHQQLRDHILSQYLQGKSPEEFEDDFNLIDEGVLDSIALINLTAWLEKHGEIEFELHEMIPENFNSVNSILDFVKNKKAQR